MYYNPAKTKADPRMAQEGASWEDLACFGYCRGLRKPQAYVRMISVEKAGN